MTVFLSGGSYLTEIKNSLTDEPVHNLRPPGQVDACFSTWPHKTHKLVLDVRMKTYSSYKMTGILHLLQMQYFNKKVIQIY